MWITIKYIHSYKNSQLQLNIRLIIAQMKKIFIIRITDNTYSVWVSFLNMTARIQFSSGHLLYAAQNNV